MPKTTKKSAKKSSNFLLSPIILAGIVFLVALGGYFGYQRFLDWQNKNLIEGMAKDYPALIAGVEEVVDHPLTITSDCLQTREKFSSGVSLCGLTVGLSDEDSKKIDFDKLINYLESQKMGFIKSEIGANKQGYRYTYNDKKTCSFRYEEYLYLDCAFGVREANKQLASELLSEESLNTRKNELLNQ